MEKKISCNVIEDLMPLYSEGLCSEDSKALIEEHLKDCENCRRLSEQVHVPEIVPEQEPEQQKAFLKINRKLKRGKLWGILISLPLCVLLIGLGKLTYGQIKKEYPTQSFETIWRSVEVRRLVSDIAKGKFAYFTKHASGEAFEAYGLDAEDLAAIPAYEKERLQLSYGAVFGDTKVDSIQIRSYYSSDYGDISTEATITYDNFSTIRLHIYKNGDRYDCYAYLPPYGEDAETFERELAYANHRRRYIETPYYTTNSKETLALYLTRNEPLDERYEGFVRDYFAPACWQQVLESVAAFYEKGYAVTEFTFSEVTYDKEKKQLYLDVSVTAEDAEGSAIMQTRIISDMAGWLPPKPEDTTVTMDGCTQALADDLAVYFGE